MERMSFTAMRTTMPPSEIMIRSSSSVTASMPTTLPLRSVVRMLMTPFPPRDWSRYSSTCERLP